MADSTYVVARTALLDALEALGPHRDAAVLVGAQAIYIHTGDAGLAVAESTTDADLALDPARIPDDPELAEAMRGAKFFREVKAGRPEVGIWSSMRVIDGIPAIVKVDLLMPDAVGGAGHRASRVAPHEQGSVRNVHGLEGCLVDRALHTIVALDPDDDRSFEIMVAGPAALLVSKIVKLQERTDEVARGRRSRLKDKDALDVLRILRAVSAEDLAVGIRALIDAQVSAAVAAEALEAMPVLFGTPGASASQMAADAAFPGEPRETIAASCAALTTELLGLIEASAE